MMTKMDGTTVSGTVAYYMPFGEYRGTAPVTNMRNNIGFMSDLGFTGHQHNNDLGLVYMNARFYVPGVGKFACADTIIPAPTNPQSYNRYAYVLNNPLKYIDPSGHCGVYKEPTFDHRTGKIISPETGDKKCHDQYYDIRRDMSDDGLSDDEIDQTLGSYEDWNYREDAQYFDTLRDYGASWDAIIGHEWVTYDDNAKTMPTCLEVLGIKDCSRSYEPLMYNDLFLGVRNPSDNYEILPMYVLHYDGNTKIATGPASLAFRTNIDNFNKNSIALALTLGGGTGATIACVSSGATAGLSLGATLVAGIPSCILAQGIYGISLGYGQALWHDYQSMTTTWYDMPFYK